MHQLVFAPTLSDWRRVARRALSEAWPPEEILWQEKGADQSLLDLSEESVVIPSRDPGPKVPRDFMEVAVRVACHSDSRRWSLLYQVLWRLTHGEPHLLQVIIDPAVHRLRQMEKEIRRDVHKMRAFVRFRSVQQEGVTWYVAWFEPQHHIVELNAPFFVGRFAGMAWSILTPDRSVHWDGEKLSFSEGVTSADAPREDAIESLWIKYYSHIFNPARVKLHAMQSEMPKKYWKNLPEAAVISDLVRESSARVKTMMAKSRAKQD